MHLLVGKGLQAVLGSPQKLVGLVELQAGMGRQITQQRQRIENLQYAALLQQGLASAAHQLKGLRNKLDLANAARTKLDVVLHALALYLTDNLLLEVAQ